MKNLYVGNLPHSTTEAELRDVFEPHGAVEKVTPGDGPRYRKLARFRVCGDDQCRRSR